MTEAMEKELDRVFRAIDADDQWDVAPMLGLVLEAPDGTVMIEDFPMHPSHWEIGPVPFVLAMLANAMEDMGAPPMYLLKDSTFHGVVLINEGWALSVDKDAPQEEIAEAKRQAEAHVINENPDRIETRMLTMVTKDNRRYGMTRYRNDKLSDLAENDGLEGTVPDFLQRIAQALDRKAEYVAVLPDDPE